MIEAILATDMGKHFGYCKELEDLPPDQPFDPKKPVDRQHLINIVIHSRWGTDSVGVLCLTVCRSDLSGQVFPTPVARQWEERISQEFNKQATEEKALGMEPAPFMQVRTADPHTWSLIVVARAWITQYTALHCK